MTFYRRRVSITVVCFLFLLFTGCASHSPADPQHVGIVGTVAGFPSVIRNGKSYLLANRSRIYTGDIVQTDEKAMVNINMIDETRIILGNGSHLVIHEYDYEPGDFFPRARLSFSKGVLRARTENITRRWFGRFEIHTPLAVVYATRAHFWSSFSTTDNTLDVGMIDGDHIKVVNDHGSVQIKRTGRVTTVLAGSAPAGIQRWSERKLKAMLGRTML